MQAAYFTHIINIQSEWEPFQYHLYMIWALVGKATPFIQDWYIYNMLHEHPVHETTTTQYDKQNNIYK